MAVHTRDCTLVIVSMVLCLIHRMYARLDCLRVRQKEYRGEMAFFDLQYVDLLKEYEGKLVIDWGKSTRMWHQKAVTDKPIVEIASKNQKPFVGFESLILSFDELKEVIENDTDYKLWQTAMSSVNAVYLIVDIKTGDRYVGSTYGYDGLLGRWSVYAVTGGHGNNKGMIEHFNAQKHSCHDLQFSVLQVLSKAMSKEQIIDAETLWKKQRGHTQNWREISMANKKIKFPLWLMPETKATVERL